MPSSPRLPPPARAQAMIFTSQRLRASIYQTLLPASAAARCALSHPYWDIGGQVCHGRPSLSGHAHSPACPSRPDLQRGNTMLAASSWSIPPDCAAFSGPPGLSGNDKDRVAAGGQCPLLASLTTPRAEASAAPACACLAPVKGRKHTSGGTAALWTRWLARIAISPECKRNRRSSPGYGYLVRLASLAVSALMQYLDRADRLRDQPAARAAPVSRQARQLPWPLRLATRPWQMKP